MEGTVYTCGASGFLFRSNKLMDDHQTGSLWHHMTGEPVVGRLAHSGIRLRVLPVVIATWKEWRTQHPDTLVLDIRTGHARDYTPGRPYGRYLRSQEPMFPVSPRSDRLRSKEYVLAVRIGPARKAFPLEAFKREPVVNDRVGTTNVVAVGKPESRTARAYERGTLTPRRRRSRLPIDPLSSTHRPAGAGSGPTAASSRCPCRASPPRVTLRLP